MSQPPTPFTEAFGAKLRTARKAKKLSLRALAKQVEPPLHFQGLSRYEKGQQMPFAEMIVRLARALGCPPADLLPGIDSLTPPTNGG